MKTANCYDCCQPFIGSFIAQIIRSAFLCTFAERFFDFQLPLGFKIMLILYPVMFNVVDFLVITDCIPEFTTNQTGNKTIFLILANIFFGLIIYLTFLFLRN